MQAVRSKGSKIEVMVAKALWANGIRYRKNDKTVFGKPDLTFKRFKVAVFIDSEFWHGFNWEVKKNEIKSNRDFWHTKIERNIARDIEVNDTLIQQGWIVLRFWGKEVRENLRNCTEKILLKIDERKNEKANR